MSLLFEMPRELTAEKLIESLVNGMDAKLVSKQKTQAIFYDSFDWRLYSKGLAAKFMQTTTTSSFILQSLANETTLASAELSEVPAFSNQFKSAGIRKMLAPILGVRALLPICKILFQAHHINILNHDKKTVLRITIEDYEQFNSRVCLHPIKGYDKVVDNLSHLLSSKYGLKSAHQSILPSAIMLQDNPPGFFSSKINLSFLPEMSAENAANSVFRELLNIIKTTEAGVIADTDSEFLHDYRVAVRKSRTGLNQLKELFPVKIHAHFAGFFSWLGQVTSPTRDLDVYILNFEHFKSDLPIMIREDINPLYEFLMAKKQQAHLEMVNKLRSENYVNTLFEWECFLNDQSNEKPKATQIKLTISELANRRIWKNFKRVVNEGNAITESSPAELFHELRKSCKKLRYLIEFFQSLYPEDRISILIKKLKDLQEILGDYQDYAVQESHLKIFGNEMLANNIPVNTFLAMGVLIQNMDTNKGYVRKQFNARFEAFKQLEKPLGLKKLFKNKAVEDQS
jgi:CHAD domain-containing protein